MAYAVVVSLKHTLEPLLLDSFASKFQISTNSELKVMYEHLLYVKSFFEKVISLEDSINVEKAEREIKDVVQNSQDLIESHLSDLFHPRSDSSISGFYPELMKVNGELASLVKDLKAKEDCLTGTELGSNKKKIVGVRDAAASRSFDYDFGRNQVIVGMDDELFMLLDRLTDSTRSFEVVPIVGMGGIGKTTLAKQVYFHPLTKEHFYVCLFVEIGVEYDLKELLLRLLRGVGRGGVSADELGESGVGRGGLSADELGLKLFQHLYARRYLIVLDDMWDTEVWDRLRRFFPDNSNGSRIMLTTRHAGLAQCVCRTDNNILEKRFLDDYESWKLLRKMALSDTEEGCPPELENVGKAIAKNMRGLPLWIVTIGKLLSSSERSVESWTAVAENTHSPVSEILNMSFTQLPQHLKACFLYLGLFPPNSRISTALLIKLWVAEGFIEEDGSNKSLEEKAEEYLHVLVDRSLVIIDELRSGGGIKTCRVHDLLLDLCVTEARLQKLYHIVNEGAPSFTQSTNDQRRLGIYTNVLLGSGNKFVGGPQSLGVDPPLVSGVRSLVFICPPNQQPLEVNLEFRWLRVLHALSIRFWEFPDEVMKLVRLRYLAITYDGELPSSISRLRNLEFLIIHRSRSIESHVFLPLEIWKLQKLRHLDCMGFDLPDPSAAMARGNVLQLRKLATLLGVSDRTCTESVLARIPNLIKLEFWYELTERSVELVCFDAVSTRLQRLESFKCGVRFMNRPLGSRNAIGSRHAIRLYEFPSGLRKLTLSGCGFEWDYHMTIISQLPNLQVLKLRWRSFCGEEWIEREGGFLSLKWLVLEDLDMELWITDDSHFPVLEHLHIRRCFNLMEIPNSIGDIVTLRVIVLDECSESAIKSARLIEEEQEDIGNDSIQIKISR